MTFCGSGWLLSYAPTLLVLSKWSVQSPSECNVSGLLTIMEQNLVCGELLRTILT